MKRSSVSGIGVCSVSQFAVLVFLQLSCLVPPRASAVDLAVGIDAPIGRVSISSNLVYSLVVTNQGNTTATGVRVTNELALEMTFISATTSQGACSHEGRLVVCNLGGLAASAFATISIRTQPTVQGEVFATAIVESDQVDENPEDNRGVARNILGVTDLVLTINNPPEPVVAGQVVTYVLSLTNLGPDPSDAATAIFMSEVDTNLNELLSVTATSGLVDTASSYPEVLWDLLSLQPGETAALTLQIRLLLAYDPESPSFRIDASVSASPYAEADPHPENNNVSDTTVVSTGPGLLQWGALYPAYENSGEVVVEVVRRGGNTGTVSVHFTTLDGTAVAGTDYLATNGVLTFLPGEEYKLIPIPILPVAETKCLRFFSVRLHSPGGGAFLRGQSNAIVAIVEDYIDIIPRGVTECITVTHSNALRTVSSDTQWPYSITPDGRYVLFSASVDDLVASDHNASRDVFRRDLTTGITRLVSVNQAGIESASTNSLEGRMSGDGRYVVFQSGATNLTTNSVLGNGDIFVRDMEAGITRLVSRSTNGLTGGNLESHHPTISSNGLVMAFTSLASDLVPSCPCDQNSPNIYALNVASGTLELVTQTIREATNPGGAMPEVHGMSADGRFILFLSSSDELVEGDANDLRDVFVRDLQMKKTILVTQNYQGTGSADNIPYDGFQISPDGRFVLFSSLASNLVPEDTNDDFDVFLRDLISGTTRLVSVNRTGTSSSLGISYGGTMTPDGRYVAFVSQVRDLLSEDLPVPTGFELFLRDMVTGTTTLVTRTCLGTAQFNGDIGETIGPIFSGDGKRLFFTSRTSDLVPGNPPGPNIYMRDLAAGITTLVSANSDFTGGGNRESGRESGSAVTSWDGKTVLYPSYASDLAPVVDKNKTADLFVWRELLPGTNAQVNLKTVTEARGPVLFISLAVTNLGPDTAHNIVVSNALSSGIHLFSFNTTGGSCSVAGNQILCALGDLPRRGGVVISLLAAATGIGVVEQAASVTSNTSDPLSLDNSSTGAFTMTLPAPEALSITQIKKNIFINWLDTPAGFQLRRALAPDSPAEWSAVTLPTFDNGVMKTAIETNESSAKAFYRLHRH